MSRFGGGSSGGLGAGSPGGEGESQSCPNCTLTDHTRPECPYPMKVCRSHLQGRCTRRNCGYKHVARRPPPARVTHVAGPLPNDSIQAERFNHSESFKSKKLQDFLEKEKSYAIQQGEIIYELRKDFAQRDHDVLTNHFRLSLPDDTKNPLHLFVISGIDDEVDPDIQKKSSEQSGESAQTQQGNISATPREPIGGTSSASTSLERHSTSIPHSSSTKALARRQKQQLFNRLVEKCYTLRKYRMDYATDGIRFIVSWKDMRSDFNMELSEHTPNPGSDVVFQTTVDFEDGKQVKTKILKVHYKNTIPISSLSEYSDGTKPYFTVKPKNTKSDISPDHAINLVLAKVATASSSNVFHIGRNKIYLEDTGESLAHGIVAYKGFFSTVKVGMGRPLLNVSLATTAFWQPGPLIGFPRERAIGRKVKVCYGGERIKTIHGFGKCPKKQMFKFFEYRQETEISVLDYLRTKPEIPERLWHELDASENACVNTAPRGKRPEWFPMELLEIAKYQPCSGRLPANATARMIEIARASPFEGLQRIVDHGLRLLGNNSDVCAQSILASASINIQPQVLEVPARQLSEPVVRYSGGENAQMIPTKKWNLARKRFYDTTNIITKQFLVLFPFSSRTRIISRNNAARYGRGLAREMSNTGIRFRDNVAPDYWFTCESIDLDTPAEPEEAFRARLPQLSKETLVVFVNPSKESSYFTYFDHFKRIAEQECGLQNVCITHATLTRQNNPTQYFANVAMKVNLKLRNYNHAIASENAQRGTSELAGVNLNDTIVLGADVTHTQKESDPGSSLSPRSLVA